MSDRQTDTVASEKDLWDWIPTGEFSLPSATIQTTFKTRVLSLIKRYRKIPSESLNATLSKENLESLSNALLDRIVPSVDWKNHAQSLDSILLPWCETRRTKFVVSLNIPHSGNAEILKYWADEHGFRIIDPPHPSDLLESSEFSDDAWFEQFKNIESCWVLPGLERCYLRHEFGLARIRRFFDLLVSGRLGFGVLGCSSWAWSFFRHALGVSVPFAFVAKPFDSEKLKHLLGILACGKSRRQIQFRQSDSGRVILSSASDETAAEDNDLAQDPFLRDLAAFSYGIPGVMLAYWRSSLQAEPDTLDLEKNSDTATAGQSTIWVKPWINIEKPGLPKKVSRHHAFILHSLLLHDTLDMDMLLKSLPLRQLHFGQTLYDLSDNGLIEFIDDQIRVSAKGYPVVRSFLKNEGFLTDEFA